VACKGRSSKKKKKVNTLFKKVSTERPKEHLSGEKIKDCVKRDGGKKQNYLVVIFSKSILLPIYPLSR